MTSAAEASDQHAVTFLNRLADIDDQYAAAQLDRRRVALDQFEANDWKNVCLAHDWASRMETATALRCCAIFPSAGAYVLATLLPLAERVRWLELAAEAVRRIHAGNERLLDAEKLFSVELNTFGNLGIAYHDSGRYREAARCQIRALRLIPRISEPSRFARRRATTLVNLAVNFNDLGKPRSALSCVQAAFETLDDAEIPWELNHANAFIERGRAHKRLFERVGQRDELERAFAACARGLELAQQIESLQSETDATGNLGGLHYLRGEWAEAEALHRRQLVLARSGATKWSEGSALRSLALDVAAQGREAEAQQILEGALEVFTAAGEEAEAADVARRLAEPGKKVRG